MKKLSIEVITLITTYLVIRDKLNLACICKKYHKIVTETELYGKLVFRSTKQFNQARALLEKTQLNQLVHHLGIQIKDRGSELIVTLPAVFPGIRHFEWGNDTYYYTRLLISKLHFSR